MNLQMIIIIALAICNIIAFYLLIKLNLKINRREEEAIEREDKLHKNHSDNFNNLKDSLEKRLVKAGILKVEIICGVEVVQNSPVRNVIEEIKTLRADIETAMAPYGFPFQGIKSIDSYIGPARLGKDVHSNSHQLKMLLDYFELEKRHIEAETILVKKSQLAKVVDKKRKGK